MQGQVQDQLTQHKAQEDEVSSFIKNCRVMEQRVSQDIQTLKEHLENYGYEAPRDAQRPTGKSPAGGCLHNVVGTFSAGCLS